ncbi:MAG: type I-D CRISPR-associated protein Cas7/Csc2 [Candidatus Korarchaeota archaeon]|nr:type I-D CRISPR-associated protein Cas7/Csc2 [Candidatus Korarchaeota archaeon]
MTHLSVLSGYSDYLEDEVPLYRSAKTVQILLMRETHDYSIFRTEETRELNAVALPMSSADPTETLKVAFLASKQKAPESRAYITLFRTYAGRLGVKLPPEVQRCALKDRLCMQCPRCVLFGAVSTETGRGARWNIKHRIEYSTAYSVEPYEEIMEILTFNAVDPITQSTEQALGSTQNVQPLAHFPSVVTLNSVTEAELIWYLKTLLATKSYGAESRVKGDVVNHVLGVAFGMEEVITSLEYSLEMAATREDWLSGSEDPVELTERILRSYSEHAAFPSAVKVMPAEEVRSLVEEVRGFEPNAEFIQGMLRASKSLKEKVEEYMSSAGRGGRRGRRSGGGQQQGE